MIHNTIPNRTAIMILGKTLVISPVTIPFMNPVTNPIKNPATIPHVTPGMTRRIIFK